MQGAKFVKVTAAAATALWLAGCASTSDQNTAGVAEITPPVTEEVIIETMPVLDPAVQAVVDSGKVNATPEQIEQMLDQDMFQFGFDSSKLQGDDYKALDAQAAYLNSSQGQGKNIVIQGHTDERGTRTYNLALGERRANTVKNYLVAKGVAASRIEVISFGFEKPLDTAHDKSAWAKNRRAVIVMN